MKPVLLLLLAGILPLLLIPVNAAPTAQGQQLFFDDFTSSQLSPNWNPHTIGFVCPNCVTGNITQTGGWITLTDLRTLISNSAPNLIQGDSGIIANNTSPIVSSTSTPQFIFMTWKMVPFNLTQVGNNPGAGNVDRNGQVFVGLTNPAYTPGFASGIGFQLTEVDNVADSRFLAPNSQREAVALTIVTPGGGTTTNCFATFAIQDFRSSTCSTGHNSAIIYSNPNSPIDLNTVHSFSFMMSLRTDNSSWVAGQVDSNGWYNVTQTACNCIENNSHTWASLYPTIQASYAVNNYDIGMNHPTPSQSLATQLDYVLVDNYVPTSLPGGQNQPGNPGNIITPTGYKTGTTFPNIWQYYAYSIGNGVPQVGTFSQGNFLISPLYFGGYVLTLVSLGFFIVPAMLIIGPRHQIIYTWGTFFVVLLNFLTGVLPIVFMAAVAVILIAIMTKTLKGTMGDEPRSFENADY